MDTVYSRPPSVVVTRPSLPVTTGKVVGHIGSLRVATGARQPQPRITVEHVDQRIRVACGQEDEDIGGVVVVFAFRKRKVLQDDRRLASIRDDFVGDPARVQVCVVARRQDRQTLRGVGYDGVESLTRSEEHTSELQSRF